MADRALDVAVVGGGLVGSAVACALAPTGLRIAVVEAVSRRAREQPSYDDRVLAIAPGSKNILDTVGIWGEIPAAAVVPIRTIHISDRGRFGFARLRHDRHGVDAMGYAVPARVLGAAVDRTMDRFDNVALVCPAEVAGVSASEGAVGLELRHDGDRSDCSAALAVVADGAGSAAGRRLGLKTTRHDYDQCVVLTTVTPDRGHGNVAYERFTPTGPLALLPSGHNRYTVVWTARSDQVEELLSCPDEEFLGRLQLRFGDRVGRFHGLGRRTTYPLSFSRVERPVRPRVVVVGNAAHTIHPVAGQGLNLGLRDVATLSEVVSEARQRGRDIGGMEVLERYWAWRRRDINRMSRFTDGLVRVFCSESVPVAASRDAALIGFDLLPCAQAYLVRRTMGLAGRLPRLARGLALATTDAEG